MYYYGLALVALDVYLAIHAYNTGRERWIFFILLVPFAGALVYLFVAWIPDMERRLESHPWNKNWHWPRPATRTWGESNVVPRNNDQDDPAQKLKMLKGMLDEGLITEADYEEKKTDILSKM